MVGVGYEVTTWQRKYENNHRRRTDAAARDRRRGRARSVLNPAWAGVCDEDIALEQALMAGGYLSGRNLSAPVDDRVTER